jgi:hypothetical protein
VGAVSPRIRGTIFGPLKPPKPPSLKVVALTLSDTRKIRRSRCVLPLAHQPPSLIFAVTELSASVTVSLDIE